MKKDFYDLLGVSKGASDQEIKSAYRKKAMKYHPDRYAGKPDKERLEAENRFKEISEAYTVLSNPEKRRAYDQFGDPNAAGGHGNPFGGQGFGAEDFDLHDIFNSFFGGQQGGQPSFQGDNLAYTLDLSLEEAAKGIEKQFSVRKKERCGGCQGSGAKSGSKPQTCGTCRGSGKVTMQQGFMAIQRLCHACQGEGVTIQDPCSQCQGKGCYDQNSKITVRIPAGVDTGDRMRVPQKGDAGIRNAPYGDLLIHINVKPHTFFQRDGVNLHCDVPISFYQACIGGEVKVPTLDSTVTLKIPPETQSGSLLRLRHKGIKSVKTNQTGDIICHIVVETPVKLSKAQKSMIEDFDKSLSKTQRQQPKTHSFMDRLKHMFSA